MNALIGGRVEMTDQIVSGAAGAGRHHQGLRDRHIETEISAAQCAAQAARSKPRPQVRRACFLGGRHRRGPQALGTLVKSEIARWTPVLKAAS